LELFRSTQKKPTMERISTIAPIHVHVSSPLQKRSYRIESIDLLRGLVMIIMALDHTRDFFHSNATLGEDPLNFATTTPALFLTRWITHFCAPVFVFLAGTSAFFQNTRKTTSELSKFLITRGLWLILIEVVVINFAFSFDPNYSVIGLQTIWSIGISMVLLGLVIWMPFPALLTLGLIIVFGHNALDFYERQFPPNHTYNIVYSFLHHPGLYPLGKSHSLLIFYPFLPWTGLMILGYCFGKLFTKYESVQRRKVLTWLVLGIILFFIALRATNLYGDANHWSTQKTNIFTLLSFVDTVKYPPSLLYMCMTIGPAILFIAWWGNVKNGVTKFIAVYGRVPFFYYVLHFFLIHLLCTAAFFARGHSFAQGIHSTSEGPLPPFNFVIPGEGYSLGIVYLVWIFVFVSLYPLCKWFSEYKQKHKQWWLSYL
jgi:uncharacterized membrane protein